MAAVLVELFGSTIVLELLNEFSDLDDNASYVATDFEANVDIYEQENGDYVAVECGAFFRDREVENDS